MKTRNPNVNLFSGWPSYLGIVRILYGSASNHDSLLKHKHPWFRLYRSTPIGKYFSYWKSALSHPLHLSTHKSYAGFEHLPHTFVYVATLSANCHLSLPVGSLIQNSTCYVKRVW
jgi:hypothetical protein